jgi:tetratricopeptide (TPR) repeat protein
MISIFDTMKKHNPTMAQRPGGARLPTAALQARFATLANKFQAAYAMSDFQSAAKLAEEALKIAPGHMQILSDYALCLMRIKAYGPAYDCYMRIRHAPANLRRQASSTWLDGLTELCGHMGKTDEMRTYGLESLNRSDAIYGAGPSEAIPENAPPVFDASRPTENFIAYSLFGANPRYCEPAVENAVVTREVFKGWTCRVYLDASVPEHVPRRLTEAGAQVIRMDGEKDRAVHPLMWRFLVVDDPSVKRFLIRDADALLSEREYAAVQAWVDSPRYFHLIRDYPSHTELILAGLWGGCTGIIKNIVPSMQAFETKNRESGRFIDQHFLRENVWPTLRKSVLCHDDLFGFHHAQPFPAHGPNRWKTDSFHVGSNTSYQAIGNRIDLPEGSPITVRFSTPEGAPLFDYSTQVHDRGWQLDMPFFIVQKITAGDIVIRLG